MQGGRKGGGGVESHLAFRISGDGRAREERGDGQTLSQQQRAFFNVVVARRSLVVPLRGYEANGENMGMGRESREREGRDEKTSTCDDCKIRGISAFAPSLSVSDAFANIQKEEWEDGG